MKKLILTSIALIAGIGIANATVEIKCDGVVVGYTVSPEFFEEQDDGDPEEAASEMIDYALLLKELYCPDGVFEWGP